MRSAGVPGFSEAGRSGATANELEAADVNRTPETSWQVDSHVAYVTDLAIIQAQPHAKPAAYRGPPPRDRSPTSAPRPGTVTVPPRDFLKTHPFLGTLRWFRRPRKGSSVERTIDALCERRDVAFDKDGNVVGLPSNRELAERLGISEATVRQHIEVDAGRDIEGLEMLPARSRIWLCYWHTKWMDQHQTPPTGSAGAA